MLIDKTVQLSALACLLFTVAVTAFGCSGDDEALLKALPTKIKTVTPATGPTSGGTVVRIEGDYFPREVDVFFGANQATDVVFVSSSELMVLAPIASSVGSVGIQVRDASPAVEGQVSVVATEFEYFDPAEAQPRPTTVDLKTSRGPTEGGTISLVTGENIVPGAAIFFGFEQGTVHEVGDGAIVIETPETAEERSVDITVQNPDGQFARITDGFSYYLLEDEPTRPVLAQVDPPQGSLEGGTAVSLTGVDLPAATDLPLVIFGTSALTGLVDGSVGELGAPTAAHALGSVAVSVTTADGLSTRLDPGFTYTDATSTSQDRLRVLAIIPDKGGLAGGEEITVIGLGFAPDAALSIGGEVIETAFVDENTLTGLAPGASAEGSVDVVVELPDGASFTLKEGYTYDEGGEVVGEPEFILLAAIPGGGPLEGGTQVRLRGVGFTEGDIVLFDGEEVGSELVDENTLVITAPPVTDPRQVDIAVRKDVDNLSTLEGAYTYFEPAQEQEGLLVLVGVPDHGPTTGGSQVTLHGLGFTQGAVASFGVTEAPTTFLDSHTLLVTTPSVETAGLVDVSVRLPDESTSALRGAFLYEDSGSVPVTIDQLGPAFGPIGLPNFTVISGSGFDAGTEVNFGDEPAAEVEFLDANTLAVVTPTLNQPAIVDVEVINSSQRSATLLDGFAFVDPEVIASPPAISRIEPGRGPSQGGTQILLRGIGFEFGARVRLGNTFSQRATVLSSTRISVETPGHAPGPVTVSVINPNGLSAHLSPGFLYYVQDEVTPRPSITSIQPSSGFVEGGTPVVLDGRNLDGATTVFVGGRPAPSLVVVDGTRLTFSTPQATEPGRVQVLVTRTDGMTASLEDAFSYRLPSPSVTAIVPPRGPEAGGTIAQLEGENFVDGLEVFVGGLPANVLEVLDDQRVTIETPPGPTGAVDVTLQNPDGQSDTLIQGFAYGSVNNNAPTFGALEPNQGPTQGGSRLVLRGTNFDPSMSVRFGETLSQEVTFISATLATVVTPPGAEGQVDVVVVGGGGASEPAVDAFAYLAPESFIAPAPQLAGISPTRGSTLGGARVTAAGADFTEGVRLFIGGRPAADIERASGSLLTAISPQGVEGLADVEVTNPDGQSDALRNAFEFLEGIGDNEDPEITGILPDRGPTAGGTRALMTGRNFRPGIQILVAGRSATGILFIDASTLSFRTPSGTVGSAAVTVINTDGRADTILDGFTYLDPDDLGPGPLLTGILPPSGNSAGGQAVLLTGERFDDLTRVFLGGRPAQVQEVLGQTLLRVLTPAIPPSVVDVEAVDGDGQTALLQRAFTYTNEDDVPPPSIARLIPNRGTVLGGTVVSVIGTGFTPQTDVFISNRPAEVIFVASTHLQAVTPANLEGSADVTAVNFDGQTATLREGYTYLAGQDGELPPQILGVTPNSGRESGGDEIVISGSQFVATPSVLIGGRPASDVRFISNGLLRATSPPGTPGLQDVVVSNPNGQSDIFEEGFTFSPAPNILDVSPEVGPTSGGTLVSISGEHFQQGAVVRFGDTLGTQPNVLGPSVIEVLTPPLEASTLDVTVINPDAQRSVSSEAFTFIPAPSVEAVRPNRGPSFGGSFVLLTGEGFRAGARVFFGEEESLEVTFVDEDTLTAQLPVSGPGTVDVRVLNPAGQQDTLQSAFTYLGLEELGDPPELTRVVPGQGPTTGGTVAIVEGENLDSDVVILFGRAPAAGGFVHGEGTRVSLRSPAAASPATVAVLAINGDGQMASLQDAFRYSDPDLLGPAPRLQLVAPDSGSTRGDDALTLTGADFAPGALVFVGGRRATNVQVPSSGSVSARSPIGTPGAADVSITNIDGQSATLVNTYLYVPPPEILAVTPPRGPATTETRVTISGNHFVDGATVTVGGRDALDILVRDAGTLLATIPAAEDPREGGEDLTVTNPDGQSTTLPAGFTYTPPPTVASIEPTEGPAVGGSTVQIHGADFQPGAIVEVGNARATGVTFVTDRQLSVTTPPGAAGPARVTVTNPDAQTFTLPGAYTYIPAPRVDSINPTSGSLEGGGSMDISGNFFQPGAQVLVGANAAGDITFISAQVLEVTIPAGAAGPAAITVINPDDQRGVLPAAYTYVPPRPGPSVVGITPNFGDEVGGTNVTILGNFFQFGAQVFFDGVEAVDVEVFGATFIQARTPGHAPGLTDVVVLNPDDEFATLSDGFSYVARGQLPDVAVTQVLPNTGSINGNTRVQVVGAGFRFGSLVSFDGVPCTDIRYVGPTIVTCTTGAHSAGIVDVSLTNPGGDFATLSQGFTYGNALALELDGWRLPPEALDMVGGEAFDADNDGDIDALIYDDNGGTSYLYVNDGTGTFLRNDLGRFEQFCSTSCQIRASTHGDIDNDGDIDVLVGMADRAMGLFLNRGDGSFERHLICPNNNCNDQRWRNILSLALTDLDTDGDLDLVVADDGGPNSVAINQGPGVFENNRGPFVFSAGALPEISEKSKSLSIGDVDRDGDIDLLFGNRDEEQNRLYLNQGDATFTDATGTHFVVSGGDTRSVKLLDIDGDLDLDALIFNSGQQDRAIINDGEGRFTDQTLGRMPADNTSRTLTAQSLDIDNDGDFDLIMQHSDGSRNRVLLNLDVNSGIYEDRTEFRMEGLWNVASSQLVSGDWDGDSFTDIIVVNNANQNQLWMNNGQGEFTDQTYEFMPTRLDDSRSVDLGDIDNDGDLDMMIGNGLGEDYLYLNDGSGHFFDVSAERLPITVDSHAHDIRFEDINGDGDLDAFIGNFYGPSQRCCSDAQNFVFVNDGSGFFTDVSAQTITESTQFAHQQSFSDLDGDGDLDHLVASQDSCNEINIYRNLGDGLNNDGAILSNITNLLPQFSSCMGGISTLVAQDFNGDGFVDIFAGFNGNQNRLWLSTLPNSFGYIDVTSTNIPGISDRTQDVVFGDFDGDQDLDLFLANNEQRPRIHLNQGDGTFSDVTATNLPDMRRRNTSAAAADLDQDGDIDFFLTNESKFQNTVFLNTGNNSFTQVDDQTPWDNDNSFDVAIGDIDGDGDDDVIVVGNGQNRIYFNKLF